MYPESTNKILSEVPWSLYDFESVQSMKSKHLDINKHITLIMASYRQSKKFLTYTTFSGITLITGINVP